MQYRESVADSQCNHVTVVRECVTFFIIDNSPRIVFTQWTAISLTKIKFLLINDLLIIFWFTIVNQNIMSKSFYLYFRVNCILCTYSYIHNHNQWIAKINNSNIQYVQYNLLRRYNTVLNRKVYNYKWLFLI